MSGGWSGFLCFLNALYGCYFCYTRWEIAVVSFHDFGYMLVVLLVSCTALAKKDNCRYDNNGKEGQGTDDAACDGAFAER